MSKLKQAGRPEGRPEAGERDRIEGALAAVGEVLGEEGLRMVAGGATATDYVPSGYDLKSWKAIWINLCAAYPAMRSSI